jgi:hypothetical protein
LAVPSNAVQTGVRAAIGVLLVVAVILVILLVLPLLGVPIGFGPFASHPPTPSASASPSVAASPSEAASPSTAPASQEPTATPTAPDEGFICGLPVTLAATGGVLAHTADVRVGTHVGYDRIVFEYAEDGTPAFEMRTASPPYVQDASGLPMTVNGSPVMEITLNGATKLADDGSLTYTGPTEFAPGFAQLVHLIERGDFEAVNSWYVGFDGGDCIRAAVLTDPSRLVIDLEH